MAEPRQNIQIVAEDFIDGPPLDFSFQNITELTEIIRKQPRSGQRLPIPQDELETEEIKEAPSPPLQKTPRIEHEEMDEDTSKKHKPAERLRGPPPPGVSRIITDSIVSQNAKQVAGHMGDNHRSVKKQKKVHRISTSINLGYNSISELTGFIDVINRVMLYPTRLVWIDLSKNLLRGFTQEFSMLPELRSLYYHGNLVDDYRELLKLRPCPNLKTLTLTGNPIEKVESGYRLCVIAFLPFLRKLDTGLVTLLERDNAQRINVKNRRTFPNYRSPQMQEAQEAAERQYREATS